MKSSRLSSDIARPVSHRTLLFSMQWNTLSAGPWYRFGTGCTVLSVQIVHGAGHIGNDGRSETQRHLNSARLGAERSLVQIQSPRLKPLLTRGFSFASRGTNWATGNNFSDRAPSCGGLVPGRTRTDASPSRASTTSRSKPYAVQPWRCSLAFVSAMFALMFERFALVAARFRRFFCRLSFARSRPQAGSAVAATGIRVFVIVHAT